MTHFCDTHLWHTSVPHLCDTCLWHISVTLLCSSLLWHLFVTHSCDTPLWLTSVTFLSHFYDSYFWCLWHFLWHSGCCVTFDSLLWDFIAVLSTSENYIISKKGNYIPSDAQFLGLQESTTQMICDSFIIEKSVKYFKKHGALQIKWGNTDPPHCSRKCPEPLMICMFDFQNDAINSINGCCKDYTLTPVWAAFIDMFY